MPPTSAELAVFFVIVIHSGRYMQRAFPFCLKRVMFQTEWESKLLTIDIAAILYVTEFLVRELAADDGQCERDAMISASAQVTFGF